MNIDERLERLTARHEAVAQTVELMAAMQKQNDRRFVESIAEWDRRMGQVMVTITQLSHIAESHDHRLDNLEGNSH